DALALIDKLDLDPVAYRDIPPVFEEQGEGEGTSSNQSEARLQRLLLEHHFPPGECRPRISISDSGITISTEPDWYYEPAKLAGDLDGMSRALHGDPKQARKDQIIRGTLEDNGYRVIVVQSRDINDPQAVRQHLKNIAEGIGRADLPVFDESGTVA